MRPRDEAGLLACRPSGERELLAQGWQARFVGDERMVADAMATYGELGYEVTTLALDADGAAEVCAACALVADHFSVIYTRRRS